MKMLLGLVQVIVYFAHMKYPVKVWSKHSSSSVSEKELGRTVEEQAALGLRSTCIQQIPKYVS